MTRIDKRKPAKALEELRLIQLLSTEELDWLKNYEAETGFEPLHLEDFIEGEITFRELARRNITWWEDHAAGVLRNISDDIPSED